MVHQKLIVLSINRKTRWKAWFLALEINELEACSRFSHDISSCIILHRIFSMKKSFFFQNPNFFIACVSGVQRKTRGFLNVVSLDYPGVESKTEVSHPAPCGSRASKEVRGTHFPTGKKPGRLGNKHRKVNSTDFWKEMLLMDKILHHQGWWLSHDSQGFDHPGWCGISSINIMLVLRRVFLLSKQPTFPQFFEGFVSHIFRVQNLNL